VAWVGFATLSALASVAMAAAGRVIDSASRPS
jgi:hypothetical protein